MPSLGRQKLKHIVVLMLRDLAFGFGGGANHIITSMDATLLGGSSRPALY